eukprot:9488057-Heterocapsa_arctica.AAC.1
MQQPPARCQARIRTPGRPPRKRLFAGEAPSRRPISARALARRRHRSIQRRQPRTSAGVPQPAPVSTPQPSTATDRWPT